MAGILFSSLIVFAASCNKDNDEGGNPPDPKNEYRIGTTVYSVNSDDGIVTIKDNGQGSGTKTLSNDTVWMLDGFVFVNDGQVLTIEPGTIIKGKAGQAEDASALIVARGGKVMAEGTKEQPIIMTSEVDNIQPGQMMGTSLDPRINGLWGGLIILGKSPTNNTTQDKGIEGIPTSETRGRYGGNLENDNSGVFRYISIRHGGTNIGEGNEINGLTMGAVGSGTEIDYIEVFANTDDGFEWFGGTVTCKHLVAAFSGDDSFDYDESFRGYGQFWIAIQAPDAGDRIGEHDGGPSDNEFGQPYAIPTFYNVTYIGRDAAAGTRMITFRDNAGGRYFNSIFVHQAKGIDIEYLAGSDDSYQRWENGHLAIENNIFYDIAENVAENIFTVSGDDPGAAAADAFKAYFSAAGNSVSDPGVSAGNPVPSVSDWGPLSAYPAHLETVNYKGALDPGGTNWLLGWTMLDNGGYLD